MNRFILANKSIPRLWLFAVLLTTTFVELPCACATLTLEQELKQNAKYLTTLGVMSEADYYRLIKISTKLQHHEALSKTDADWLNWRLRQPPLVDSPAIRDLLHMEIIFYSDVAPWRGPEAHRLLEMVEYLVQLHRPRASYAALLALRRIHGPKARAVLQVLAKDPDELVRAQAVSLLKTGKLPPPPAHPGFYTYK